jgi:aryl-alcohol dehydrogenase-like predicted oxidoreductase
VSYRELMRIMAQERGLSRRLVIPVPVLTPRLSSLWIHLVTPLSRSIARPLAEGLRNRVVLANKVGLEWHDGKLTRNASRERITQEIDDSLRRLRTDYIDIYQVHWPDPLTPIEETAEAMLSLLEQGKIRAIGVSNFSVEQMDRFRTVAPLHVAQPPYNLF